MKKAGVIAPPYSFLTSCAAFRWIRANVPDVEINPVESDLRGNQLTHTRVHSFMDTARLFRD